VENDKGDGAGCYRLLVQDIVDRFIMVIFLEQYSGIVFSLN